MKVDKNLILKLEKLSMLQLSEEERLEIVQELEKLIAMIDIVREADFIPYDIIESKSEQILRSDKLEEHLDTNVSLRNTLNKYQSYFTVPKVIKEK